MGDAGRLTGATKNNGLVESYSYDANGNRRTEINALRGVNRSYSVALEDHVITTGSAAYQFDMDGFLTQKTLGASTTASLRVRRNYGCGQPAGAAARAYRRSC